MTGFKSARMIVLSFVTLTEGVSIGYAPKIGPANSWPAVIYLSTLGVIAVLVLEIAESTLGLPNGRKKIEGRPPATQCAEGVDLARD